MEKNVFLGVHGIPTIEFVQVRTLQELLDLKAKWGHNAVVVAGGTDLIPAIRKGKFHLDKDSILLGAHGVEELKGIAETENELLLGACTTLDEIVNSELIRRDASLLREAVSLMGSLQVRQIATIGGNVCNASPAADGAVALLGIAASVELVSTRGVRKLALDEFFLEPGKTVLGPDEILLRIRIPKGNGPIFGKFLKCGRRTAFTLSIVALALSVSNTPEGRAVRVALGSVAPTPIRAKKVEELLSATEKIDSGTLEVACEVVAECISPIDDVRATALYRKLATRYLLEKALIDLMAWESGRN